MTVDEILEQGQNGKTNRFTGYDLLVERHDELLKLIENSTESEKVRLNEELRYCKNVMNYLIDPFQHKNKQWELDEACFFLAKAKYENNRTAQKKQRDSCIILAEERIKELTQLIQDLQREKQYEDVVEYRNL